MNDGTVYTGGGQAYWTAGDKVVTNHPLYYRHPSCGTDCQYGSALNACVQLQELNDRLVGTLHKMTERKEAMSQAIWCDPGAHAFSAKDKGRRKYTETIQDENGREQTETYDVCSIHNVKMVAEPQAIAS